MLRQLLRYAWALLLFGALPIAVHAQFDTATVLGAVRDGAGANVANATVTLRNTATGITTTTQSDAEGNYQFINVKIGVYQITSEAQGFAKAVAENIQVTVGARQRVDLSMKAGAITETIMVADTAPLLETEERARPSRAARTDRQSAFEWTFVCEPHFTRAGRA